MLSRRLAVGAGAVIAGVVVVWFVGALAGRGGYPPPSRVVAELIPTLEPLPPGQIHECAGLALTGEASLRARLVPGDGHAVAEAFAKLNNDEVPIRWPPGYQAIFDPLFSRVLTAEGATFAVAGDDLNRAFRWRGHVICFYVGEQPGDIRISVWPETLVPTPTP